MQEDATSGAYPGSFTFSIPVTYNQTYGVTVLQQPVGANCTVANGVGTVTDNVANVTVTCVKIYRTIS